MRIGRKRFLGLLTLLGLVVLVLASALRDGQTPSRSVARSAAEAREAEPSVPSPSAPGAESTPADQDTIPPDRDSGNGGLRVTVVDERGRPRPGAQVKVLLSANPVLVWTNVERAGEAGEAEFPTIAAGRVVVYAAVGSLSRTLAAEISAGLVTAVRIPVPRGVQVEGHVRHVERGPLGGLVLSFQRREGDFIDTMEATTDTAGLYRLTNAPAGRYLVWTRPGMGHAYLDVPGVDSVGNDFVFGVLCLSGTVRDATTERPLAQVPLQISDPFFVTVMTDSDGAYRFFDLPRGSYWITLRKEGYAVGLVDTKIDDPLPCAEDVSLHPAARLRLQIMDIAGRAVTGAHNYSARPLGSGSEAGGNVVTDGSGWIVTAMAPGVYDLSVFADGYKPASQHVEILPGENTAYIKLEPKADTPGDPALRGVVRDRTTGLPVAGVTLWMDGVSPIAVTDEQGEYRYRHHWTGKVSLFVLRDGYGASILREVSVEKGTCRVLDLALEPAATLELNVTDRDGKPIEGSISLRVTSLNPDRPFNLGTRVGPAKEGRLTYSQLLPGAYRLTLSGAGGRATVEADVPAGASTLAVRLQGPE